MIQLSDYGYTGCARFLDDTLPARITAVHRQRYEAVCAEGFIGARLKRGAYPEDTPSADMPTVGDYVRIHYNRQGDGLIVETLPRTSFFSRRNPTDPPSEQPIAANFDYVLILTSLNREFNPARLERYAVAAHQSGAVPIIVLTKADLLDDCAHQMALAHRAGAGAAVVALSAHTGQGLDALTGRLTPGATLVFLGSSGVGKSSLINALAGAELMAVRAIREGDARGRHTTTHRQLMRLPGGLIVIDTPGMRELGMWEADEGLSHTFADIEALMGRCRFADCRHQTEPGCAVRAALFSGVLTEKRLNSYRSMRRESDFAHHRAEAMRVKQARNKAIAQQSRRDRKKH